MTDNYSYNNVQCSKCGHDQNSSTARKCEICGKPLKKTSVPPFVFAALAGLIVAGGGYFAFQSKLIGKSPSEPTTNTVSIPTVSEPSKSQAITNEQPNTVQETQSTPPTSIESTAASIDISLPNPTVLAMDGSTTMVALMQKLRNAYAQINPNMPTIYGQPDGFPKGSTKGIEALMNNSVIMAATSRPLKPQEAQAGIQVVTIARDAVAIVVGVNNPFKGSLTQEQLSQIYQGKITNWSQVGGVNAPIRVVNRAASSGTRDFFQSVVLLGQPFASDSANFITFPNDETTGILRLLGNDGISYATVSQVENQQLVRVVPLNGISPVDKTAIQDGKYPISRNVYLAIRKQNSPAIKQFIDLALSPQGQQIVQQSDFIPLK
ncbi:substrate-binding domain-containing protein [Nostoc sp. FACHB-892]|uniref:substrate-binding domain-containing protein n=1 Tax=Nostoc sp. FACHB-892 TaxID=2692843 RepID=UPI0016824AE6|nr:substrate-binding domain-containing protein [Nostoc sp. FACHB-892]MBD2730267.1 substrate-binding domain-containing protein [Nostoc sp. FACHB-892]